MFGVTTTVWNGRVKHSSAKATRCMIFHATGNGGQAMESLIRDGHIAGVLDITTTELADEHVGGFLSAGPERLTAAGAAGVPQVVSTGALDMVNFYAPDSVPPQIQGPRLYRHNANVTLMRTTAAGEPGDRRGHRDGNCCGRDGAGGRAAAGPRGVGHRPARGSPSTIPSARRALHDAIRAGLPGADASKSSICTSTIRRSPTPRRGDDELMRKRLDAATGGHS